MPRITHNVANGISIHYDQKINTFVKNSEWALTLYFAFDRKLKQQRIKS